MTELLEALYRGQNDRVDELLAQAPELNVFEAAALGKADRVSAGGQLAVRVAAPQLVEYGSSRERYRVPGAVGRDQPPGPLHRERIR